MTYLRRPVYICGNKIDYHAFLDNNVFFQKKASFPEFLVACNATTPRFVRPSIGWSLFYYVFTVFGLSAPAQML